MRRVMLASVMIAGILLLNLTAAIACGDKTLRIGRGARFKRPAHPAAVLIYIAADAPATTMEKVPRLQQFLKTYGNHKARIVQGADKLNEALDSGHYDVVLSNLVEAPSVQKQIESFASKPAVVPMVLKGMKNQLAAAQKQYRYIVKDPNYIEDYLDAIEGVMREKTRKA
jgi:hypothetical protein